MADNIYSGLAQGLANGQSIKAARQDSALKQQQLQLQQQEFGLKEKEFQQNSEIRQMQIDEAKGQQKLKAGLNNAFSLGGYEGALDYLKANDMSMYMQVQKAKSDMDQSMITAQGLDQETKNKKVEGLRNSYTILGKMGAQLMKVDPMERAQAYQSILPAIKAIYPDAPDTWSKDAENLFTMTMGLSMPDSVLYGADKLSAKAQTDIGKISQDLNLLRTQGVPEDDPRIETLKNKLEAAHKDSERAASDKFRYAASEDAMRKEYVGMSTMYNTVKDMYVNIQNYSSEKPTTAKDMLLINSVQRMQDPGASVKEGDYATVKNAGSWPSKVRAQFNQVKDGTLLSAEQREGYLKMAKDLMDAKNAQQEKLKSEVTRIAVERGYDPKNIVIDLSPVTPKEQAGPPPSPDWIKSFMQLNPNATQEDAMAYWQYKQKGSQPQQSGGQQNSSSPSPMQSAPQPVGEGNPPWQAGRSFAQ